MHALGKKSGLDAGQPEVSKKSEKEGPQSGKYSIRVMETDKSKIPQRGSAKLGVLPKFPFSMMISGSSGSGKTNLLMNIMTREDLYGAFFHYIIVFSPTAGSTDDMYKALKIPKENFIHDMKSEYITNLTARRKERIEAKGIEWVSKNERMCIILDDIIAERSFLESPDALKMFSMLRHYLCSIIVLVQSYNKLPRALRLQSRAVMVFPAQQSEIEVLIDEITPAGITKKAFEQVIYDATSERYQFLYINRDAKPGTQIRKNLDEIINLEEYKYQGYSNSRPRIRPSHVITDRRSAQGGRSGSESPGSRGQNLQSGHPGNEEETGERAAESSNARQLLSGSARFTPGPKYH